MSETQTVDNIRLEVDSWKIRIREKRNNRMKLHINLSKDEAVAYKNFKDVCKPEEVNDEQFLKTVFITGIQALNQQLSDLVQEYAKANKEDLASSGITVLEDEEGNVQLESSEDAE